MDLKATGPSPHATNWNIVWGLLYNFYFWLCRVFIVAQAFLASGGYSLVAVCRLLVAVASLVVDHRLGVMAHELGSCGSQTVEHTLNSCGA